MCSQIQLKSIQGYVDLGLVYSFRPHSSSLSSWSIRDCGSAACNGNLFAEEKHIDPNQRGGMAARTKDDVSAQNRPLLIGEQQRVRNIRHHRIVLITKFEGMTRWKSDCFSRECQSPFTLLGETLVFQQRSQSEQIPLEIRVCLADACRDFLGVLVNVIPYSIWIGTVEYCFRPDVTVEFHAASSLSRQ